MVMSWGSVKKGLPRIAAGILSISAFLLFWQIGTDGTEFGKLMPTPVVVLRALIGAVTVPIGRYTIQYHVLISLGRVMIAYLAACVIGNALGLAMARNRWAEAVFRPFYETIRSIPPIAWISMAILWFGLGEMMKYFIIFLSAFASITYTTFSGAQKVDPTLIGAARMLGAGGLHIFTTVVLPASVPYVFSGMQVALGTSWATVVAAEMVRSSEGVGWVIVSGMESNNMQQIMVGIVTIGIVGLLLTSVLRRIETRLCAWNIGGV